MDNLSMVAAGGLWGNIGNVFTSLTSGIQGIAGGVIIAMFVVIGLAFVWPSEKSRNFAKSALPFLILGSILIFGAAVAADYIIGISQFK